MPAIPGALCSSGSCVCKLEVVSWHAHRIIPFASQMADNVCRLHGWDLDADMPLAFLTDIQREWWEMFAWAFNAVERAAFIGDEDVHFTTSGHVEENSQP
jgi:hypothetical protein